MEQLAKAVIRVEWGPGNTEEIKVQYNPNELSLDKSAQFAEIAIPGIDAPLQQFVRGQSERMTLELFFDTTEDGMGKGATSVTTETDKIYGLLKIIPDRHAPPICTFVWNDKFPGCDISANLGNQRRNQFKCIVESVRQRFTLFNPDGVPLRATLSVTLREYKTLVEQLDQLNLSSPDRTHAHITARDETLAGIAHRYYEKPRNWRAIAEENGIEDPRRLEPGRVLTIPPIR